MSRNIEQKRANFALDQVIDIEDKDQANDIKTGASRLIALILNSGFLQSLEFAKGNLKQTYIRLCNWIAEEDDDKGPSFPEEIREAAKGENLHDIASRLCGEDYCRVMAESLAFLGWLKSKAEGKKTELSLTDKEMEEKGLDS